MNNSSQSVVTTGLIYLIYYVPLGLLSEFESACQIMLHGIDNASEIAC